MNNEPNNKAIQEAYDVIMNVNYSFSDDFGISYLRPEQHNRISEALSLLRSAGEIVGHEYQVIRRLFKIQYQNFYKVRELTRQQPRVIAQKFIGKKNVREFIFKRDGFKCLCCGADTGLSLDHIIPIYSGGENKLSNLQTLCFSCNSKKSTEIIDYRNG